VRLSEVRMVSWLSLVPCISLEVGMFIVAQRAFYTPIIILCLDNKSSEVDSVLLYKTSFSPTVSHGLAQVLLHIDQQPLVRQI
jgi:hypothetical protein